MIVLIVAMTKDRVIGLNGELPWHIPSDLVHFKAMTGSSTIIMGRKTFESLHRVNGLPNRKNIVVSSSTFEHGDNVVVVPDLASAYDHYKYNSSPTFIIGGAMLYKAALDADMVNQMCISEIKGDYKGDTYFPEFDESKWILSHFKDKGEFFHKELTRK